MSFVRSCSLLFAAAAALFAAGATGCSPAIGDDCETSVNCDINGTRICDLAQPGGYCTVQDCESNTCPPDSHCVEFEPNPTRLARTFCMASCDDSSDCRDAYKCVRASDLGTSERPLARVVDEGHENAKFCTHVPNGR